MYASTLWPVDGFRTLSDTTLALVSTPEPSSVGPDDVLKTWSPSSWCSTGFAGPHACELDVNWFGPRGIDAFATAFGSPGAGGALGVADARLRVAAAFVPTVRPSLTISTSDGLRTSAAAFP